MGAIEVEVGNMEILKISSRAQVESFNFQQKSGARLKADKRRDMRIYF